MAGLAVLARCATRCVDTGHATLSAQLPDGGWRTRTWLDLLVQQPGIGEMRLLAPALRKIAHKRVVLLQPPHAPQTIALAGLGMASSQLIWVKSPTSSDALWAAEQVLRSGSCGALPLFWCTHVRPESLRRLHLAAQAGETLFSDAMRPIAATRMRRRRLSRLSCGRRLAGSRSVSLKGAARSETNRSSCRCQRMAGCWLTARARARHRRRRAKSTAARP